MFRLSMAVQRRVTAPPEETGAGFLDDPPARGRRRARACTPTRASRDPGGAHMPAIGGGVASRRRARARSSSLASRRVARHRSEEESCLSIASAN